MSIAMSADPMHENYSAQPRRNPRPGRLKQEGLEDAERNFSVFMHLSPLIVGLVGAARSPSSPPWCCGWSARTSPSSTTITAARF